MAVSQNVCFFGPISTNEGAEPPGCDVAELVAIALGRHHWRVFEIDNWRDTGWRLECAKPGAKLEIVIAKLPAANEWLAQISPVYFLGPIGRLLRRRASAPATLVADLARDVHAILSDEGRFSQFKWRWDDYPSDETPTSEPTDPVLDYVTRPRATSRDWRPTIPAVDAEGLTAVLAQNPVVVLHCYAVWNLIDQTMDQTLHELRSRYADQIHFRSFDVDPPEHQDLCREWQFWNLPALVCFMHGHRVDTVVGCLPRERLIKRFDRWLGQAQAKT